MVSFARATSCCATWRGCRAAKQVERAAEALGREIAAEERSVVEPPAGRAGGAHALPGHGRHGRADGVGVEAAQASSPTALPRRARSKAVWSARAATRRAPRCASRVGDLLGRDRERPGTPTTTPSEFGARVEREAMRRGFDARPARRVSRRRRAVDLEHGDRAISRALQIVDLFHAKDHLGDVARRSTGRRAPSAARGARPGTTNWTTASSTPFGRHSRPTLRPTTRRASASYVDGTVTECATRVRAAGLCTSTAWSGRLQGRDRHAAQAGRHALDGGGADAIIALRCCKLSGRFEDFWERRSAGAA